MDALDRYQIPDLPEQKLTSWIADEMFKIARERVLSLYAFREKKFLCSGPFPRKPITLGVTLGTMALDVALPSFSSRVLSSKEVLYA
jgi:hypothetical protein